MSSMLYILSYCILVFPASHQFRLSTVAILSEHQGLLYHYWNVVHLFYFVLIS